MDFARANYVLGRAIAGFQDYDTQDLVSTMERGGGYGSDADLLSDLTSKDNKVPVECAECGSKSRRKFGPGVRDARCSKCGSYDIEVCE